MGLEFRCVQAQPPGTHGDERRALKLCYAIPSASQLIPTAALPALQDQPPCHASAAGRGPTHLVATSSHQIWHCSLPAPTTSSNSTPQKPASVKKWFPTSIDTSVLPKNSFTCVCSFIHCVEHLLRARRLGQTQRANGLQTLHLLFLL